MERWSLKLLGWGEGKETTHIHEFYFQDPHQVFMVKTGEKKNLS